EAVLDLMASGQLDPAPLITHRFAFEQAPSAYDVLANEKAALGIILTYEQAAEERHVSAVTLAPAQTVAAESKPVIGVIGAGNYASRMLIPAFRRAGAVLHSIAAPSGVSGVVQGRRAGFSRAMSDPTEIIKDPAIDSVVIATRHDSHAELAVAALRAGTHVFVEKPPALTLEQLADVRAAYSEAGRQLMVGFNRRFAPHMLMMKRTLAGVSEPKTVLMVMNAGAI